MIEDILVHVDNSGSCAARLDVAMSLAKTHDARLRGVFVRTYPKVPRWVMVQMGADGVEGRKRYEAQLDELLVSLDDGSFEVSLRTTSATAEFADAFTDLWEGL